MCVCVSASPLLGTEGMDDKSLSEKACATQFPIRSYADDSDIGEIAFRLNITGNRTTATKNAHGALRLV